MFLQPAVAQNNKITREAIQQNEDMAPTGTVRRQGMKAVKQQANMGDVAQLAK